MQIIWEGTRISGISPNIVLQKHDHIMRKRKEFEEFIHDRMII